MVVSGYENYFECVWAQCHYTWTYSIFIQNHSLFSQPTLDYISKSSRVDEQAIIGERESAFTFWTHTYTKLQTNHWRRIKRERKNVLELHTTILILLFLHYSIHTVHSLQFFSHIEYPDDILLHLLKCAMPSIWPSISSVTNQPDRQYQPWLLTSPSWLWMWSDCQKCELANSLWTL